MSLRKDWLGYFIEQGFDYTEKNVEDGMVRIQRGIVGYKKEIAKGDPRLKRIAERCLPSYEAASAYFSSKKPNEILTEVKVAWEHSVRLKNSGADDIQIGQFFLENYGDVMHYYTLLLARGFVHELDQKIIIVEQKRKIPQG